MHVCVCAYNTQVSVISVTITRGAYSVVSMSQDKQKREIPLSPPPSLPPSHQTNPPSTYPFITNHSLIQIWISFQHQKTGKKESERKESSMK